ncbi:hypothetical protein CHS0354_022537 [Potamilus streckersoni]|uniref:CAAX prenyl protease 2/Lysostaphin resistance protein A-like domain-containing protein n=1 Tax=Potamilus streckersoni TaxID=2493646 RepID=A0AAE0TBV7_9BIVA|nr:hypothetical protein CHS0354_022537 [Potamilus streckersoni]
MICLIFTGAVLFVTAVWVWMLKNESFMTLAYAMFFPGAAALAMSAIQGDLFSFFLQAVGIDTVIDSIVFSAASVVIVCLLIGCCVILTLGMGWASIAEGQQSGIHEHNKHFLAGYIRAAGEELGWRCYLLPCLMARYEPLLAVSISGIAWGLFHVPVMILLTYKLRPPRPYLTVFIQCLSCIMAAFPHGWVAIKSGYSLWAATIMHGTWNQINPRLLGSIYTQTPGKLVGPQWVINGEGLAGVITILPLAALLTLELKCNWI